MADSGREDAVGDSARGREAVDSPRSQPEEHPRGTDPGSGPSCPECASAPMTLLRESEVVSVYKCPTCGHLTAPVKKS
jgi:hypothetical protein